MEDNSFQVDSQTKVAVYSLEYLRRLVKLLSKTPKRFVVKVKSEFLKHPWRDESYPFRILCDKAS